MERNIAVVKLLKNKGLFIKKEALEERVRIVVDDKKRKV